MFTIPAIWLNIKVMRKRLASKSRMSSTSSPELERIKSPGSAAFLQYCACRSRKVEGIFLSSGKCSPMETYFKEERRQRKRNHRHVFVEALLLNFLSFSLIIIGCTRPPQKSCNTLLCSKLSYKLKVSFLRSPTKSMEAIGRPNWRSECKQKRLSKEQQWVFTCFAFKRLWNFTQVQKNY